jgi:hypothetical protein
MVSWLFQLIFLFVFDSTMICHMDNFYSIKLVFFLIDSYMGVCSHLLYNETNSRTNTWHVSPHGFRVSISWHVLLIPMCKWFPISLKFWMTPKSNKSQTSIVGIRSWTCVGGCKSMWKAHNCGITTSNCKASPKKHQNMVSRFVSWFVSFFLMRATSCHLKMIWVEVWLKTQS